jgi:hypothetical protein
MAMFFSNLAIICSFFGEQFGFLELFLATSGARFQHHWFDGIQTIVSAS